MIPDLASERRAFEAWYATTGSDWTSGYLNMYGQYPHPEQEQSWQGWLARSAIPTQEGYVLVPVEPTEAMIAAWANADVDTEIQTHRESANIEWKAMISASQSSREG